MNKPSFSGDPRNENDLLAYERELRAWEEAKADAERYDELYKADEPGMELQEAIGRFLDDPEFRERLRGPEGLPGMNGAPGKQGVDGAAGADGADGAPGADGADGADGNDWRVGAGAPTLLPGDEKFDLYLNTTNGDVYQVQDPTWAIVANIMGPTGATGATGATGPAGADGADATNWSEHSAFIFGPSVAQAFTTTEITVDADTLVVDLPSPGGDWSLSATGELTQDSGQDGYYLINYSITLKETGGTNDCVVATHVENEGGNIVGASRALTVPAGYTVVVHGTAIVVVLDTSVIRMRVVRASGTGTPEVVRFGSSLTITKVSAS